MLGEVPPVPMSPEFLKDHQSTPSFEEIQVKVGEHVQAIGDHLLATNVWAQSLSSMKDMPTVDHCKISIVADNTTIEDDTAKHRPHRYSRLSRISDKELSIVYSNHHEPSQLNNDKVNVVFPATLKQRPN